MDGWTDRRTEGRERGDRERERRISNSHAAPYPTYRTDRLTYLPHATHRNARLSFQKFPSRLVARAGTNDGRVAVHRGPEPASLRSGATPDRRDAGSADGVNHRQPRPLEAGRTAPPHSGKGGGGGVGGTARVPLPSALRNPGRSERDGV